MACNKTQIYDENFYDLIIDYKLVENYMFPECLQPIDERFQVGYYSRERFPLLSVTDYSYGGIPHIYCLTDASALEVTNIMFLQKQPALELQGEGVLVGFVDTGIQYDNPLFRNPDGTTRIVAIWDQTAENAGDESNLPKGFLYGREYTKEKIDLALREENPFLQVPVTDDNGHGTFLAGVCCGGGNLANNFVGAVPLAAIAAVKCKEAKQNLRDYYFIPEHAVCYQENDIMAGVAWLRQKAEQLRMPLVICIGMGCGLGSHSGDEPLSILLEDIGLERGRAVTVAAGNEANARHHYEGRGLRQGAQDDVEISVGSGVKGFVLELWAGAAELYQVAVVSPTGEVFQPQGGPGAGKAEYTFLFEGTTVSLEYEIAIGLNSNQLVFLRFFNPLEGIWIIRVTGRSIIQGNYNMWLPMGELITGEVFFLRSVPDITATSPAYARFAVSTGAFAADGSRLYPDSGRGFSAAGEVKPDLAAPGVDITGPDRRGNFITMTGTSISAALTAGACAQLLEWGIVKGNYQTLNSSEIRTILIRGAKRSADRVYPNREWGYGALDVLSALNQLRNQTP